MNVKDYVKHTYAYSALRDGRILERFGPKEAKWVENQITKFWQAHIDGRTGREDFEYADNTRLAVLGDVEDMKRFQEIEDSGCCGSYTTRFGPSPMNFIYIYGFNYGH